MTLSIATGECLPFYIMHTICSPFRTAGIRVRQWGWRAKQGRRSQPENETPPPPSKALGTMRIRWRACRNTQCLKWTCTACNCQHVNGSRVCMQMCRQKTFVVTQSWRSKNCALVAATSFLRSQLGLIEELASFQFMSVDVNWIGHTPQDVELKFEPEWQEEEIYWIECNSAHPLF